MGFRLSHGENVNSSSTWYLYSTTKFARHRQQSLVASPEFCSVQGCGSQQVHVDVTDAYAMETMALDVAKNLGGFSNCRHRQVLEQVQRQRAIRQAAAGNLSDDEWMHDHCVIFKQLGQTHISDSKMINPHRCVDQNQAAVSWRRRGGTFSFG